MGKRRKVKVPICLQMEELEGGAACLDMILAYYGKWVRLDEVRVACKVSRDGIGPDQIAEAAEGYGLSCGIEAMSIKELKERKEYPVIAVCDKGQYMVLCGFDRKGAAVNHPSKGRVSIKEAEFEKRYTGSCMIFKQGEGFVADGKRRGTLDFVADFIRSNRRIALLLMITSILATCGGIFSPVFYRVFTDDIMNGGRTDWYPAILYAFAAVILFELISGIVNQLLIIRSKGKVAAVNNAKYMRHIFRLPMEFFMRRKAGDLSNRQEQNAVIAETFVGDLIPQLMNIALLVFYLTVMISYSVPLTIIGVLSVVINLMSMKRIGTVRRQLNGVYYRCKANLASTTVSGIDMIESIKATGAENAFFERWSGYHASMINSQVRSLKATKYLANAPALTSALSEDICMFIGFILIIRGQFTEGMFLTFMQLMRSLTKPVDQLVDVGENLEAMTAAIERVNDVTEYPEEKRGELDPDNIDFESVEKLSGNIEIKNVSFGYSSSAEPLIKDFNLTLTPGKRVAIVGGSGSGKSTVAKMIVGLNKPWDGEILFDGKTIDEIPRVLFKASVALVDQEVALFNDTMANNIKMWDTTIEDYEMILSARDAGIHDQIRLRNGGYNMMVEPGGRNLSGGERQRVEIARVLSNDPSILIMDEATSALDARTEYEISEFIHQRGITCIIVAHRLSTIRDCDEIIVMDKGSIIERGTHEELMKNDGLYKKLIMTA